MGEITAGAVNELRKKTGAGMMDCKKALNETQGDLEKAVEVLRKKGLAAAAKKAGRIAAEGLVRAITNPQGTSAVVIEVNCETDFVAKTEDFVKFSEDIAEHVLQSGPSDLDELLKQKFIKNPSLSVGEFVTQLVAKIGENIQIRRFGHFKVQGNGSIGTYIHAGGQIGVMAEIGCEKAETSGKADFTALAKDLCLHVAAQKPLYLDSSEVPAAVLKTEIEIAKDQARQQGKKEDFLDKIAEGKVRKYYEDTCLIDQGFVKDPGLKVSALLAQHSKALSDKITLRRFARFELGEGIEKKVNDFAAEVAATMGSGA